MEIFKGTFLISVLAMCALATFVAQARSVTCPPPEQIKTFAQSLPPAKFVIDGPGLPGVWAFQVNDASFIFENRNWYLGTWLKHKVGENINEARNFAIPNVLSMNNSQDATSQEAPEGLLCLYKGKYGAVIVGTQY